MPSCMLLCTRTLPHQAGPGHRKVISGDCLSQHCEIIILALSSSNQLASNSMVELGSSRNHFPEDDRIKERAKPSVHRLLCNNNCPWRQADAPTSPDSEECWILDPGMVHKFDNLMQENSSRRNPHSMGYGKDRTNL